MKGYALIALLAAGLGACGGSPAPATDEGASGAEALAEASASALPTPPDGAFTVPDWYSLDREARTVHLAITYGATPENNHWNLNGAIKGTLDITVPQGFTVTIDQVNRDPNMAHSLGIQADFADPMLPPTPNPAFEGAVTPNPTSMISSTLPGESETIEFVASEPGRYAMICYVPGHTAVGMWLYFTVSADGEAGVRGL
jgi:FtsP/CotA-like multicopper oxidase with cupredoxin domain